MILLGKYFYGYLKEGSWYYITNGCLPFPHYVQPKKRIVVCVYYLGMI